MTRERRSLEPRDISARRTTAPRRARADRGPAATKLHASAPHGRAVRNRGASASHASPFQSTRTATAPHSTATAPHHRPPRTHMPPQPIAVSSGDESPDCQRDRKSRPARSCATHPPSELAPTSRRSHAREDLTRRRAPPRVVSRPRPRTWPHRRADRPRRTRRRPRRSGDASSRRAGGRGSGCPRR